MACELVAPLFLEFEARLRGFVLKKVKDKDATHDIMHQVLLKIHGACEQIPDLKNVQAWLYQITRNAIYDYFRAESKRVPLENEFEIKEDLENELQQEIGAYIRPMIQMLPAMYAEPLALSDLEGLPQKEIAEKLGISLSGAKSRIQRGREKLRSLFTECWMLEIDKSGKLINMELKAGCTSLQNIYKENSAKCSSNETCCN